MARASAAARCCRTAVPEQFGSAAYAATRKRLSRRFGAARVDEWWLGLPALMTGLCARWQLELAAPAATGNTSLVVRCRRADGRAAMLKLTPDTAIAATEAFALRGWAPSGRVPAVWGADPGGGALLLEAIAGETTLSARLGASLQDSAADTGLEQIAGLIGDLHRSGAPLAGPGIGPLADRIDFIFGLWADRRAHSEAMTRSVPAGFLERGRELARSLAADPVAPPVLLHGDLHAGNVLVGPPGRGLVAIDPRPSAGEPAADVIDWVFWRATGPGAWAERTRELAAALDLDPGRLWAWCTAFAAMMAAADAGHGDPDRAAALLAIAP